MRANRFATTILTAASFFVLAGNTKLSASELTPAESAVARQYGAIKFYLEKGEPEKANKYIHSMYLYLETVKQESGAGAADNVFRRATGLRDRKNFFSSMNVANADGELFTSKGPCTYFWQQSHDGRSCGERSARPNERVR